MERHCSCYFFATIALHPKRIGTPGTFRFRMLFRAVGVFLILVAAWWLAAIAGAEVPPTTLSADALQKRIEAASLRGEYRQVIDLSSRMLKIAPLKWTGYYHRGRAYALTHEVPKASADFAAARALQPASPELCLSEGRVWLLRGDATRCFTAWKKALRRDPAGAAQRYTSMLELARRRPALREELRTLADDSPEMSLVFLQARIGLEEAVD
ncbi:MAG: hypothetical protein H7Y20_06135 [Bryobacteraceae bacterium]|nr:hypothetical protein [Bryobacteraceae bacterium]